MKLSGTFYNQKYLKKVLERNLFGKIYLVTKIFQKKSLYRTVTKIKNVIQNLLFGKIVYRTQNFWKHFTFKLFKENFILKIVRKNYKTFSKHCFNFFIIVSIFFCFYFTFFSSKLCLFYFF